MSRAAWAVLVVSMSIAAAPGRPQQAESLPPGVQSLNPLRIDPGALRAFRGIPAGAGSTHLRGSGGHDIFRVTRDMSAVDILEASTAADPQNELVLGPGLSPANADIWTWDTPNYELRFPGGPRITLERMARGRIGGTTYGVQRIRFADGTVWTPQSIIERLNRLALEGAFAELSDDTAGHVLDTHGHQLLDRIRAYGGGDTIVYRRGYADLTVNEEDASPRSDNVLLFGPGIRPAEVHVFVRGNIFPDLELQVGGADAVTLEHALESRPGLGYGVQRVRFADGTEWTYADLLARAGTDPVSGERRLGDRRPDTIRLHEGAVPTVDGGGGDTFRYSLGAGIVELDEEDVAPHPPNRLVLGPGITPTRTAVLREAFGGLYLDFGEGEGVALAHAATVAPPRDYGVQLVVFADGTRWTGDDLRRLAAANPLTHDRLTARRDARLTAERSAEASRQAAEEEARVQAAFALFERDLRAGLDRIGLTTAEGDALLPSPRLRRGGAVGCLAGAAALKLRDPATLQRWRGELVRLGDALDLRYGTSDVDTAPDYMGMGPTDTPIQAMGAAVDALRSTGLSSALGRAPCVLR